MSKMGKKTKSTHRLTRNMNICMSYQILLICMQPKQNTPLPGEKENFIPHEDEKLILEKQDIDKDHRNLEGKSSDIETRVRNG